jgi:nucleotide-binding universal stress UspA family protein
VAIAPALGNALDDKLDVEVLLMNRLKTIIVGTDFSECSGSALVQAARIAQWNGATLHILHVIDSLAMADLVEAIRTPDEELRARVVEELRKEINCTLTENHLEGRIEVDVSVGVPTTVFLDKVREVQADLLILGVHGASGPGRGVGSLAGRCVRKAPAKVMLIRQSHAEPFKTVVACVDFSENSLRALAQAARVAAQDRSTLHVLHVYSAPWNRLHYRAPTPQADPDYSQQYMTLLQTQLAGSWEPFAPEATGVDVQFKLIECSDYAEGIIEYLNACHADLAILGTRGRTNLRYVFWGSTAERVIRNTPCSILAIKPDEFSFAEP